MLEFSLPVVDARTSLDDAASAMRTAGVCGVVVPHGAEYRLLHLDDVTRAGGEHKQLLGDVASFTPLLTVDSPQAAAAAFIASPFRYLVTTAPSFGLQGNPVSVISASEAWADMFLCQNLPAHNYPPNVLPLGRFACVICGAPLNP
jgi:hypothetical protein